MKGFQSLQKEIIETTRPQHSPLCNGLLIPQKGSHFTSVWHAVQYSVQSWGLVRVACQVHYPSYSE